MDWRLFASTFALISVAEIPGKTTFASLLLSARTKPLPVFLGASGAFVIHSLIAVMAGSFISLLPARPVQIAVGLIFLFLAVLLWRETPGGGIEGAVGATDGNFRKIMAVSFTVIFLAQWGDPTQLATAALAAKYRAPWTIFLSATMALWTVSGVAVVVGHFAKGKVHPVALQKIASVIFGLVGIALLAQAFSPDHALMQR
jgi:putative Ca2+/H+ antiporter (TMEM165/GDT1 family)